MLVGLGRMSVVIEESAQEPRAGHRPGAIYAGEARRRTARARHPRPLSSSIQVDGSGIGTSTVSGVIVPLNVPSAVKVSKRPVCTALTG